MNKVLTAALALTIAAGTASAASAAPRGYDHRDHRGADRYEQRYDRGHHRQDYRQQRHRARGQYMPYQYRTGRYQVNDWQARRLAPPPRGYHYVQDDNGDVILAAIATGLIAMVIAGAMN